MTPDEVNRWAHQLAALVESHLHAFEGRYGYPPGAHEVRFASHAGGSALAHTLGASIVPAGLVRFFDVIEAVEMPDVCNGYFFGPAAHIGAVHQEHGSLRLSDSAGPRVLMFGSDGGGHSYVIECATAAVSRADDPVVSGGIVTARSLVRLADSFDPFLQLFVDSIEAFVMARTQPVI